MFGILKEIFAFAGKKRGLLTKALQFPALMLTLDIVTGKREIGVLPVLGVMLISIVGRTACFYYATNAETETGYFMAAEKRIHIGDRLRYIPM